MAQVTTIEEVITRLDKGEKLQFTSLSQGYGFPNGDTVDKKLVNILTQFKQVRVEGYDVIRTSPEQEQERENARQIAAAQRKNKRLNDWLDELSAARHEGGRKCEMEVMERIARSVMSMGDL